MTVNKLIAITGPAAVGKSTVARDLQSELIRSGELWLVIELDTFARGLSRDWISFGRHQGRYAERGFVYARGQDGSIELRVGPDGRSVLAAFHRSVAAIARSGVGVICETIVYDDDDWRDWSESLCDISVCWVKLSAPLPTLEAREDADRTRVFQGLARGMSARQSVGKYDLEADTGAEAASAIAHRIITWTRS
jgi:chloramphenicol 3-O phosphotransferase